MIRWVLLFFILFAPSLASQFSNLTWLNNFDEILVASILSYSIIKIMKNKSLNRTSFILLLMVVLYYVIGLLSWKFNSNGGFNKAVAGGLLSIKFFVLTFSLLNLPTFTIKASKWLNILQKYAFFSSLFMLLQVFLGSKFSQIFIFSQFSSESRVFGFGGISGLFTHQGVAAFFYCFIAGAYASEYLVMKNKTKLLYFFYYAIMTTLTMRSKSIVMIFFIALLIIFYGKKKSSVFKFTVLLIPLLYIFNFFVPQIMSTIQMYFFYDSTIEQNMSARYALLYGSLSIAKKFFPLGVGFGKFASKFSVDPYSEWYSRVGISNVWGLSIDYPMFAQDTFWPQVLGETGYFGFFVVLIMIIFIFICLVSNMKNICRSNYHSFNNYKIYFFIAIFSLTQSLIDSLGNSTYMISPSFILVSGAIVCALKIPNTKNKCIINN